MTLAEHTLQQGLAANKLVADGKFKEASQILDRLAKEVKAHWLNTEYGIGKPFTPPRS